MKRTISFLLSLVMALGILTSVPVTSSAVSSGTCGDNLIWTLDDEGTLTISGEGDMDTFFEIPWDRYEIDKIIIEEGVTNIGYSAFSYCYKLDSIIIPDSVLSIGAFAFYECSGLTSIIIPDSVKSIGYSAFEKCGSLTSITIPDSITSIGNDAFKDTQYYYQVNNWTDDVLYIGNHLVEAKESLQGEYTIKKGTKTIAEHAFLRCTGLTSLIIPDGVTSIEEYAFIGAENLGYVSIPDSVTRIGSLAFKNTGLYNDKSNWIDGLFYVDKCLIEARSEKPSDPYDSDIWYTEYVIKDGTHLIAEHAFDEGHNNANISRPGMPRGSVSVGGTSSAPSSGSSSAPNSGSSSGAGPIKKLVIPESMAYIGYSAFGDSSLNYRDISDVFYKGSKEQWAQIKIDDNNLLLVGGGKTHFKLHYNASDHTPGKWIIDKKATVNTPGSKHQECTVCGLKLKTAKITELKCTTPKLKSVANVTNGIKFIWNKVAGADSYTVMRKTGSGKWTAIKAGLTSTTYTDTTAKNGVTYKYTVKAKNEAGFSSYNTTGLSVRRLAIPTKITTANAKNGITVKWGKVTGATGYYVMRKTGNGSWVKIATVKGTSYTDKTAKSGVNYKYTIKAYYGKSVSAYNTTGVAVKRLVAPKISSAVSNREGILLKWNKVTGASGYYVYRKATSGDWKKIATVKGNAKIKYLDETPRKGVNYQYYVKAYSGKSVSVNSNTYKIKCKY